MVHEEVLSFGSLLRQHRAAAGVTQEDLAERAGLSARAISDLERGVKQHPHGYTVGRLIRALDLDEREASRLEKASGRARSRAWPEAHRTFPIPPTQLLGRELETQSLTELLSAPAVRLVTLTGTGGVGKTRLALEAARQVQNRVGGVAFVDLAPIRDATLVESAIGKALGVTEVPNEPYAVTLQNATGSEERLLVLDNYEQVIQAALVVADLLAACPNLTVIVTSRIPLHLRGEHVITVPPLAVPDLDYLPDFESLSRYPAVALFCARARETKADFGLTVDTAPLVAEICARLDGLPLAIELAAARVRLFSIPALLERLAHRLGMLTRGARDLPERQQSLRATIDWSYGLLTPEQQVLFERMAVFAGGRSLEAIEAVCNPEGELDVLGGMEALLEQGLMQEREIAGEMRFELLETLQEYAEERLEARGERENLARFHAAYFLALAEQADPELTGPEQGTWASRLEREQDNFRAALRWCLGEAGNGLIGLQLASALSRFWEIHGHHHEGRRWLEAVLALPLCESSEILVARARALNGAGNLIRRQGDFRRATALHEECLRVRRRLGDEQGIAYSLNNLGNVARDQCDYPRARALHEESLALKREVGDQWGVAASLNNLGTVAIDLGEDGRAAAHFEESLEIYRELKDTQSIAMCLHNLGEVAHRQGDRARAAALYEQSLALKRELGDRWAVAFSLNTLGTVKLDFGDYKRATALYKEALLIAHEIGDRIRVADSLEQLAKVAVGQEKTRRAARLFAAAAGLREAIGAPLQPYKTEDIEHSLRAVRRRLGDEAFRAAWTAGVGLTLEQAVREAATPG
jgi:predicted ATPase/DNA-binding XRE family transcriptional regulator/Tfp pilus assembly protein PilF